MLAGLGEQVNSRCQISAWSSLVVTFSRFIYRCQNVLTHLDLSWCGNYSRLSPAVLSNFLERCGGNLSSLGLANCHAATTRVLFVVGIHCRRLTVLNLSNCHLLEPADFDPLSLMVELESLNLHRTKVGNRQIGDFLRSNRRLQHLRLSCCHYVQADEVCRLLAAIHPHLQSLDLWRSASLTSAGVLSLVSLTLLRELDLGWCHGVNAAAGDCLLKVALSCSRLERLVLAAHRQLASREVVAAADAMASGLRQLDIMGTRHVGKSAVEYLLASCPNMELLDVGYCEQLEDPVWLRELKEAHPECNIVNSLS